MHERPRIVFAGLASALLLLVAACGEDEPAPAPPVSFVGTWMLDAEATHARMKQAGMLADLADVKATRVVIEVRVDGTYVGSMTDAGTTSGGSGTWKAEGDELTLTVLAQNGKPAERPETRSGTLREGRLWLDVDAQTAPLVLRRR